MYLFNYLLSQNSAKEFKQMKFKDFHRLHLNLSTCN